MIRGLSELKTAQGKTMKQLKQVMVTKGLREDNRRTTDVTPLNIYISIKIIYYIYISIKRLADKGNEFDITDFSEVFSFTLPDILIRKLM